MMTVFTIVALPSMAAWQLAAGAQEPDGSIASFARTMLHTLTAVIGTTRKVFRAASNLSAI